MSTHSSSHSNRQSSVEDVDDIFQAPISLPIDNRKRAYSVDDDDDTEGQLVKEVTYNCSLCEKPLTNDWHQPMSLKCGHVFGGSCLKKHIKSMIRNLNYAECPLCHKNVKKSEPRKVWATLTITEKHEDLHPLKHELEEARRRIELLQQEIATVHAEIDEYKHKLDNINTVSLTQEELSSASQELHSQNHFILKDRIAADNECFSLVESNPLMNMITISCYNSATRTFGVRKCNLYDLSVTEFIPLDHQATVKAMKLSDQGTLLSTGNDRTLKLTSLTNNRVIQSYTLDSPGISCCIDEENPNSLLCGGQNGELYIFDLRNTSGYVNKLVKPANTAPIRSIVPYPNNKYICMDSSNIYIWNKEVAEGGDEFVYSSLNNGSSEIDLVTEHLSLRFNDGLFCSLERSQLFTTASIWYLSDTLNIVTDWSYDTQHPFNDIQHFSRDEKDPYICYLLNDEITVRDRTDKLQTIYSTMPIIDWKYMRAQKSHLLAVLSSGELRLFEFN
ncbi:hypothetical protein BDF20DRAFT_997986 [Mycotypha africana]|uniref:uncharacterized protein n=1 Tax=Mycotypha africana TaxID=64632 RepID=UPI0022FFD454|nr:uncharacterized protein BDF20DRAFT_997986 [Mycotypha africana]KAI8987313.1 hypothetical protein BDF20DRAFT_997986 [Mycotypha africana]